MFNRIIGCQLVLAALFSSLAIYAQQMGPTLPVAVIGCAAKPAAKPNLLHRLLLRRRKAHPIPFLFHQSDYRALTPDTVALWHLDEARRVGVHVPTRLCAAALASFNATPEHAAAASAAKKSGTETRR